jgi:hypothetical protein
MKDIINALRRTVKEAEENGHRTIIFPVPDAKNLIEGFDDILLKFIEFENKVSGESDNVPRELMVKLFLKEYLK